MNGHSCSIKILVNWLIISGERVVNNYNKSIIVFNIDLKLKFWKEKEITVLL